MIQTILEFLQDIATRHSGEAVMAWVQFLPAALSLGLSAYGAVNEGNQQRKLRRQRRQWSADNKALFNQDYYSDYTESAEAQDIIRRMREQQDRESKRDANTAVITGSTVEAKAAAKEGRNKAMSNLYGNLGAMGTRMKQRAKDRYLSRKHQLEDMEYDSGQQRAESANNLFSNGLGGLAGMDWAGILGGASSSTKYSGLTNLAATATSPRGLASASPYKDVSSVLIKNLA